MSNQINCLAFGTHPDDIELFCSGLLIKLKKQGYTTAVIDLTYGELSTNGDIEVRKNETTLANQILRLAKRINLGFEDGNIINTPDTRLAIIKQIRTIKPEICILPYWRDRHPDHINAALLVYDAIFYAGLSRIDTKQKAYGPKSILYYMQHLIFTPTFIVDISDEFADKLNAIKVYQSQFSNRNNKYIKTYINRDEFLKSIITRAKFYGDQINCGYGEPYFYDGHLKINDIMKNFC
jgi:bacillithiol biosynthesis deacetylase BshB1